MYACACAKILKESEEHRHRPANTAAAAAAAQPTFSSAGEAFESFVLHTSETQKQELLCFFRKMLFQVEFQSRRSQPNGNKLNRCCLQGFLFPPISCSNKLACIGLSFFFLSISLECFSAECLSTSTGTFHLSANEAVQLAKLPRRHSSEYKNKKKKNVENFFFSCLQQEGETNRPALWPASLQPRQANCT